MQIVVVSYTSRLNEILQLCVCVCVGQSVVSLSFISWLLLVGLVGCTNSQPGTYSTWNENIWSDHDQFIYRVSFCTVIRTYTYRLLPPPRWPTIDNGNTKPHRTRSYPPLPSTNQAVVLVGDGGWPALSSPRVPLHPSRTDCLPLGVAGTSCSVRSSSGRS